MGAGTRAPHIEHVPRRGRRSRRIISQTGSRPSDRSQASPGGCVYLSRKISLLRCNAFLRLGSWS